MSDIILEIMRAVVLALMLIGLGLLGLRWQLYRQSGWPFFLAGTFLVFMGSVIDITDEFSTLNKYVVIGDTPIQAALEKVIGYLFGYILMTVGLLFWLPLIGALRTAEDALRRHSSDLRVVVEERTADLRRANDRLESRVRERTSELEQTNTQLQQARDTALEASRAKSEFLATMSHEIRTPMNSIIGMAELLSEAPLGSDQQEHVRIFKGAGETLLTLINDILDLSKVEAGQLDLEETNFDLGELITDTVEFLSPRAREKGFELSTQVSPDLPTALVGDPVRLRHQLITDTVEFLSPRAREKGFELSTQVSPDLPTALVGDPVRLRQVLTNLLSNAVKFTDEGQVALHIGNDPQGTEAGSILFRITDTGVGIPEEKLKSVFDSFTQVDSSTTREYGGTGLGLTISGRLVEMMGGRIWVESRAGEGSTFYFTARFRNQPHVVQRLPETLVLENDGSNEEPAGRRSDGVYTPEAQQALRILLVEDFADNRMLVQSYLKSTPYQIEIAENGEIAVEKYMSGQYDLVLMDMQMPVMDGYTATREIRKWEAEHRVRPKPIIALTANALKEDARRSLDAGCTAHLTKPIKKTPLLQAIDENAKRVLA